MTNLSEINYELSGGSFNVRRRRLATFTMREEGGKVVVSDDRPAYADCLYKDTTFNSADEAVAYWGRIDEKRIILK